MNVTQIEETVKKLSSDVISSTVDKDQFIYELMAAYGHRKTTVSRIKSGERNLAKSAGEVRAKRHIYFKHSDSNKVFSDIDDMKKEPSVTREKIRFIIATDFNQFVAVDTRTHDTLDIEFSELGKHFDFFLPWAGMEKAVYREDNPADEKAAEKMAKLFDFIKADNFSEQNKNDTAALHSLNVFLTRLLFCFFAEDTGIFADNQFSAELESHTKADGSDVDSYLNRLFGVLNTSKENRYDLPDYLAKFEYVNGGLFADAIASPRFSTKSRRMLIECGSELDWSGINPDIFGSMIQAVVHPDQRGGMGMHYTSVINIMKVIEPLFLDDLYAELENIAENIDPKLKPSRLRKLHDRIANIKIFDPACGSGNFLIIAFKELRKLEMEIIKQLQEFKKNESQDDFFDEVSLDSSFSRIRLSQFYGIELDDFAHEVAILSLWLAEHQMNVEFKAEFGKCEPALPLKESGHIVCANATRINWKEVCDNRSNTVYVIGNPPYLGGKKLNKAQSMDMDLSGLKDRKQLDYVGCWFFKAIDYVKNHDSKFAFVSTSSICQGEQVHLLWPYILSNQLECFFAYKPFKWTNNAKLNAGVWCTIVGIANKVAIKEKTLYHPYYAQSVSNISPYLIEGNNTVIRPETNTINGLNKMTMGSNPVDGKNLILVKDDYLDLISNTPEASKYFRRYMGGNDFLRGMERYCLWLDEDNKDEASKIPQIKKMIEACRVYREQAGRDAKKVAGIPYRFCYRTHENSAAFILPNTSASSRQFIPVGLTDKNTVINKEAFAIYNIEIYLFALLSSTLHRVWLSGVGGRLGEGYRYSVKFVYNTFPVPKLSDEQKTQLEKCAIKIIEIRERHNDMSIANIYDSKKMPDDLRLAHENLDSVLEPMYRKNPFVNDEDRLNHLLISYETMLGGKDA